MKKDYRKVYGYAIIMTICVLVIVLVVCLSQSRLTGYQNEYETTIKGHQEQIEGLQEKMVKLTQENAELKKAAEETAEIRAKAEKQQQVISDMQDIYKEYKESKRSEAKDRFSKIEPIDFDDASLAYYELLKDFLN